MIFSSSDLFYEVPLKFASVQPKRSIDKRYFPMQWLFLILAFAAVFILGCIAQQLSLINHFIDKNRYPHAFWHLIAAVRSISSGKDSPELSAGELKARYDESRK